MKKLCPLLLLLALTTTSCRASQPPVSSAWPELYAYCVEVGVPGLKPRPLAEQAKLLRELDFDGIGWSLKPGDGLDLKILDEAGLPLRMAWAMMNVNPAKGPAYNPALPEIIRKLQGRPVTVCVLITGLKSGDPQGMETAVKALRELGDIAAEVGARISIYNHDGFWAERIPFVLEVIAKVNHPQVGFNFNVSHWLKAEGDKDYRPLLRANVAKLFCVTINGATVGAKTWASGLIRPLDEGDFDNRRLLATLREIGYHGPVGLMCFSIPGDACGHLTRSMNTWKSWREATVQQKP